uniref:Odorant receptor n=1 Tax=Yemma signatus TaxID=300820 RepID=A0A385H5Y6_9HEMI|nr:odorant receptor [Yemma signatus]
MLHRGAMRKRKVFMGDMEWLYKLEGFGDSRSFYYRAYIGLILTWNFTIAYLSLYSTYYVLPDKDRALDCFHILLCAMFGTWGIFTRLLTRRYVDLSRKVVESGFYTYPEQERESERLEAEVPIVVARLNKQFALMMSLGAYFNFLLFPALQLFLWSSGADIENGVAKEANPFLPHWLYLPWDYRTPFGFLGAWVVHVIAYFYTYGVAIAMNNTTMNLLISLLYQLKILNHSILHVRDRARALYRSRYGSRPQDERSPAFQDCLLECLRHNIRHHQLLVRFHKTSAPFVGSCCLVIFLMAPPIFATIAYVIMKKQPINLLISYMAQLFSELVYTFNMCHWGEKLAKESGEIFESLYSVDWPEFAGPRVSRTIRVFRLSTRRPMIFKCLLLDFNASLGSYAEVMSMMYKIISVIRTSDSKNFRLGHTLK